jgi:uncharacterized protein HemY
LSNIVECDDGAISNLSYQEGLLRANLLQKLPIVLMNLGTVLYTQQKWEKAQEAFEVCTSYFTKNPQVDHIFA